jgi:epoxyqueuosine reductase
MDLRNAIAEAAAALHGWGVTTAAPFTDVQAEMKRRIADGSHAGLRFTYADPSVSTDVRRTFPWAERLVVGAHAYAAPAGSPGPEAPGTGRIARFAAEDHYQPLRGSLEAVADVLRSHGHRAEVLVDDNRLVDRAAAVRAGVGWWGRSTLVLAPGAGPWLLLGTVVTDAELPTDEPMRRDCGTCTACLPACPTGALDGERLDARRCLATWLQAPGAIPADLRAAAGDRIYGCDDCLDACPPGSRALTPTPRGRVDLVALLGSDDRSLLRRFAHFYVPRRDPRYLRRNALVALGNVGGRGAEQVAAGYLGHPDWLLRAHAAWALGRLGGPVARAALEARRRRERNDEVRAEIDDALIDLTGTFA